MGREHPEIYVEYAALANLAHMMMSTYTPGFSKPIPLTKYGLGGELQRDAQKRSPSYLAAVEFAEKQDSELLGE